jgi:hypothetical protein
VANAGLLHYVVHAHDVDQDLDVVAAGVPAGERLSQVTSMCFGGRGSDGAREEPNV